MTARNYALDTNGVDAGTVYTTCPMCGIVSPAASLEYTLLPGWNRPQACGHRFAVPAAADEICCPQCGVHQPVPAAADPARAALVARSAAQFAAYARDIVNLARHQDPDHRSV